MGHHVLSDRVGDASGPAPRTTRVPLAVSMTGFAVALIALLYVTVIGPMLRKAPASPEKAAQVEGNGAAGESAAGGSSGGAGSTVGSAKPAEAELRFTSEPPGARVYEDGSLLGTTPFSRAFAIEPAGGGRSHQFVFKAAGFRDQTAPAKLEKRRERPQLPRFPTRSVVRSAD
jgi:hypothetical protein